jgi:hypothetical protein
LALTYTIPLGNFDRQSASILDLGDARILDSNDLPSELLQFVLASFETAKEVVDLNPPRFYLQMELSDTILKNDETRRRPLDRTLTILKLFKDSQVKSNIVFVTSKNVTKYLFWRHYIHWARIPPPKYLLKQEEEELLRSFWKEFGEINLSNFAVYRFHLSDIRPYLRDRFVDCVESLEYLLVPDSGEGEIRYKFSTRGALTLATAEDRNSAFKDLRDSYDLRSAIVHGNDREEARLLGTSQWEEKIDIVKRYDREAIKYFFRSGCLDDSESRRELLLQKVLDVTGQT